MHVLQSLTGHIELGQTISNSLPLLSTVPELPLAMKVDAPLNAPTMASDTTRGHKDPEEMHLVRRNKSSLVRCAIVCVCGLCVSFSTFLSK